MRIFPIASDKDFFFIFYLNCYIESFLWFFSFFRKNIGQNIFFICKIKNRVDFFSGV